MIAPVGMRSALRTIDEIQIVSVLYGRWRFKSRVKLKTTTFRSSRQWPETNFACYLSVHLAFRRSKPAKSFRLRLDILGRCAVGTPSMFLPGLTHMSRR